MGMARQSPAPAYQRTLIITKHAIERFRERVDEEFTSRSDGDLGNLLDERVKHSEDRTVVTDLAECDQPTIVHAISNRNGKRYYAIVRDMSVITVLDEHMLELNFSSGRWKKGGFNTPFAAAAKTLRGLVAEEPAEKSVIEATKKKGNGEPPAPDIASLGASLAQRMLEYATANLTVRDMQARIDELAQAIVPLVESRERAEAAVKVAQEALNSAIATATRRAP